MIHCSAKTGLGIDSILEAIVDRVPAPGGDNHAPLQALIFDSVYNPFRGIETYFRVMSGRISKGDRIKFMATGKEYNADEVGALKLKQEPRKQVETGDVGYLITGIKEAKEVQVGDTVTLAATPMTPQLRVLKRSSQWFFCGDISC